MRNEPEEFDENESHELSFRGLWMPESIIGAFLKSEINATEAMLLAIIDGFSKAGKCYASNGYLAKRMGCKNRNIQLMLANLENAGLLRKIQRRDGSRFLQTIAGISKFDAHGDIDDTDTPAQRPAKRTNAPMQDLAQGGARSCAHNSKVNNKGKNSPGELLDEDRTAKTSPARQLARRLKEGLSGAQKLKAKVNPAAWEAEFQKLLDVAEFEEIEAAIIWLLENIEDKFTPQAYSAATFRAKFDRISAAANRAKKETIPELPDGFQLSSMAGEAVDFLRNRALPEVSKADKHRGLTHVKRWCMAASENLQQSKSPGANLLVVQSLCRYLESRTILCDYAMGLDGKAEIQDLLPGAKFKEFLKRTWRGQGISEAAASKLLAACCENQPEL
jgi:hypothetical protein